MKKDHMIQMGKSDRWRTLLIAFIAIHGCAAIAAEPPAPKAALSDGGQIVARHTFDIKGPAGAPSGGMASGPLIGNGDVGVQQTGPAGAYIFFIGKNDFWSGDRRNERGEVYSAPQPVGLFCHPFADTAGGWTGFLI